MSWASIEREVEHLGEGGVLGGGVDDDLPALPWHHQAGLSLQVEVLLGPWWWKVYDG